MRTSIKACAAIILSALFVSLLFAAVPANGASAPIGLVLQAQHATIAGGTSLGGESIYDGDHLATEKAGALRARMGDSQIYLGPSTSAWVHSFTNGISADLADGTVLISSPARGAFQLAANGATIRSVGSKATIAEVTRISPIELLLTPHRGAIEISMGNEVRTVEPGNSYRMKIETADPSSQGGTYHAASNHFVLVAIAAVTGATIYGVYRALVSPSAP